MDGRTHKVIAINPWRGLISNMTLGEVSLTDLESACCQCWHQNEADLVPDPSCAVFTYDGAPPVWRVGQFVPGVYHCLGKVLGLLVRHTHQTDCHQHRAWGDTQKTTVIWHF